MVMQEGKFQQHSTFPEHFMSPVNFSILAGHCALHIRSPDTRQTGQAYEYNMPSPKHTEEGMVILKGRKPSL